MVVVGRAVDVKEYKAGKDRMRKRKPRGVEGGGKRKITH